MVRLENICGRGKTAIRQEMRVTGQGRRDNNDDVAGGGGTIMMIWLAGRAIMMTWRGAIMMT